MSNQLVSRTDAVEHALAACALQVETVKDCQDKLDEESTQPARSAD